MKLIYLIPIYGFFKLNSDSILVHALVSTYNALFISAIPVIIFGMLDMYI